MCIHTHTHWHKHMSNLTNTYSCAALCTPIHPSWQPVNCQGVNWKWWCNCIRVLIYLALLFIYLAVDFRAALITRVHQDKLGIDRLDVRTGSIRAKPVDGSDWLRRTKLSALWWNLIKSRMLLRQSIWYLLKKRIIIESRRCHLRPQGLFALQQCFIIYERAVL